MPKREITPIAWAIHRPGDDPYVSEGVINAEYTDGGGGGFLRISQIDSADGVIEVDDNDLEALLEITRLPMFHEARDNTALRGEGENDE